MNKLLKNFRKTRILVVGDIILDKYIFGEVNRISPEAPVPILKVEKEEYRPGGAANVAENIASLQGQVSLYGAIGKDYAGKKLEALLKAGNIDFFPTYFEKTTQKIRCIGDREHQLLRMDYEDVESKPLFPPPLKHQISKSDIVIVSDYAKGAITEELMKQIKSANIKVLIDPKPENQCLYKKCFLVTPNEQEALEMANTSDVYKAGKVLKRKLGSNVIITRGKKGMIIFPKKAKPIEIPTAAKEVYDVTGAGDTVIATLALALASDSSLEEAAVLANHAAGLVVGKQGAATVKFSELEDMLLKEEGKIKSRQELKDITEKLQTQGKTVVWTNGCFDLLHEGHISYLKAAKELGDILVVGLNSDASVKRLKGKNRPVRPEQARAEILTALDVVDYITIFPETRATNLLSLLKPDIYVKASDYNLETMSQKERKTIEDYKGKIHFIEIESDISTSKIIEKIQQQN